MQIPAHRPESARRIADSVPVIADSCEERLDSPPRRHPNQRIGCPCQEQQGLSMAGMRMSMRKIREVLRLTHELGLSVREVREATGVGKTAVSEYVRRAKVVGLTWPIPLEISDAALERLLVTPAGFHEGSTKPLPDWTKVHEELKRRGVTLMILWEEHRAAYVDGHGYSRFCELYGEWRRRLSPTMPVRRLGW